MNKKGGKKKKKIFKKIVLLLILILFAAFTIYLLAAYVFDTKTKAVIIHGNNIYTDQEILEKAKIIDYPNYFTVQISKIEKELEKDDFIKDVKIKRWFHLQLHLYIEENKPLFIREDTNMIVFDKDKEIKNNKNIYLEAPYLINYVPNTKYDDLIKKLKEIDYNLLKKVSQIKYDPSKYDESRFLFYMNDSNRVYINLPKMKSFNRYDDMVAKFEGKTGTLYLDSGNYFEIDK